MSWIYEVSLNLYVGEEKHCAIYSQFSTADKAHEFAGDLLEGAYPTATTEVTIKITPQE